MGAAVDPRRQPFDLPNMVAGLAILGLEPGSPGMQNVYRRDVIGNIGDPQTYAEAGRPFFWETRAGKGDAFYIAAPMNAAGTWAWNLVFRWGGV